MRFVNSPGAKGSETDSGADLESVIGVFDNGCVALRPAESHVHMREGLWAGDWHDGTATAATPLVFSPCEELFKLTLVLRDTA